MAVENDEQTEASPSSPLNSDASPKKLLTSGELRTAAQQVAALSHIEQLAVPFVVVPVFPEVVVPPAVPVLLPPPLPPPPPPPHAASPVATKNAKQNALVARDSMRMVTSPKVVYRVAVVVVVSNVRIFHPHRAAATPCRTRNEPPTMVDARSPR